MQPTEDPSISLEPVRLIDATPDKYYPLRILRAYRAQCNCMWCTGTEDDSPTSPICRIMNEQCADRARILDKAIELLEKEIR